MVAALDLWTLFVVQVFGSFWIAVAGITLLMFIIMGVLGRISIYSCIWYSIMFVLAMGLGYGYIVINIIITVAMLVALFFSWRNYFS